MAFLTFMNEVSFEKFFQGSQLFLLFIIGAAVLIFSWSQSNRNQRHGKSSPLDDADSNPGSKTKPGFSSGGASLKQTLLLEGIRINGLPHETLGISPHAREPEIQKAYKDLMKRFHPDRVGPQGSQPWKDAQKIAEALNDARQKMLASARSRKH